MKCKRRRCRGSNPGHPRDRREYLPLYYNDSMFVSILIRIEIVVIELTDEFRVRYSINATCLAVSIGCGVLTLSRVALATCCVTSKSCCYINDL